MRSLTITTDSATFAHAELETVGFGEPYRATVEAQAGGFVLTDGSDADDTFHATFRDAVHALLDALAVDLTEPLL